MPNRRRPWIAAFLVLIVHGAIVLRSGIVLPPDGVKFAQWADLLIANRFDFAAVVRAEGARNLPAGMYMFFVTIVALAKLIAGARWAAVLVTANVLFDALTAAILIRLVMLATRSTAAVMFALAAWLVCFDVVTWVRMPLTDILFLLLSFAAFASLAGPRLVSEPLATKALLRAAIFTAMALLLRPVGFLWIILIAVVYLVLSGRLRRRAIVVGGLLIGGLIFAGHTLVVCYPERWPLRAFERSVRWDARSYAHGDVIVGRPETSHPPPVTLIDYGAITADRFVHFFAFTAASFSRAHKIGGAVFYGSIYLMAIGAVIAAARRSGAEADVVILSTLVILTVAFWHSLVVIDFDWRYRLPVVPHLIFVATTILPRLLRR